MLYHIGARDLWLVDADSIEEAAALVRTLAPLNVGTRATLMATDVRTTEPMQQDRRKKVHDGRRD